MVTITETITLNSNDNWNDNGNRTVTVKIMITVTIILTVTITLNVNDNGHDNVYGNSANTIKDKGQQTTSTFFPPRWHRIKIKNIISHFLSTQVTSVTTAAAFYANVSSNVIAVKCFGLFSGTAIVITYLLMVTLFPCCVVLHEKYLSRCMSFLCPSVCTR